MLFHFVNVVVLCKTRAADGVRKLCEGESKDIFWEVGPSAKLALPNSVSGDRDWP